MDWSSFLSALLGGAFVLVGAWLTYFLDNQRRREEEMYGAIAAAQSACFNFGFALERIGPRAEGEHRQLMLTLGNLVAFERELGESAKRMLGDASEALSYAWEFRGSQAGWEDLLYSTAVTGTLLDLRRSGSFKKGLSFADLDVEPRKFDGTDYDAALAKIRPS